MAKGDFGGMTGGTSQGSPMDLASLIARLKATQGGGQMGPGSIGGGMMPAMGQPNYNSDGGARTMQPPPMIPSAGQRPMFGGFNPGMQQMPMPQPSRQMNNPFNPANNSGVAGGGDVQGTRRLPYLG